MQAAQRLWEKAPQNTPESLHWLAYVLLKFGDTGGVQGQMPDDFERFYPAHKVWRAKHGLLSATVYGGGTHLMNACFGGAEIRSLKIAQTYFGTGLFVADEITPTDDGVILTSYGRQKPRRPGYELPLGRPVDRYTWDELAKERDYRAVPEPKSSLYISTTFNAIRLHYQTLDGLENVAAQLSFDVPAGGVGERVRPATNLTSAGHFI